MSSSQCFQPNDTPQDSRTNMLVGIQTRARKACRVELIPLVSGNYRLFR